eukprot:scaffold433797_cov31-Prasinocladus_malaysianus.AAC.1
MSGTGAMALTLLASSSPSAGADRSPPVATYRPAGKGQEATIRPLRLQLHVACYVPLATELSGLVGEHLRPALVRQLRECGKAAIAKQGSSWVRRKQAFA